MCVDPVTLSVLSFATTAGATVMSHMAQAGTAKQQARAIQANEALQQMDLARQQQQQAQAGAAEINEAARRALQDAALFEAIAGEYGGGGTAVRGAAVRQVRAGETLATIQQNYRNAGQETSMRSLATKLNASSQLASIQKPSLFGTALTIGGAALGARRDYVAATNPKLR